ncbi:MAG: LytTR family transcriptional regulator DNA-binding domain-containing protein [Bacteroidota bacterium]|nr:LytTR family transcriptional regulator DNA-binding domain-containing protein [Bacteroidota bacterium]MDX5431880.1 LytTR family transcriptional regulator DNA-binding domain-containing protein [Bacteroidota bacterium]MDX5470594.1 LytTR family transcriptional regulator DNA-binding domain-containing protein [Bacteroidota bacterium]
MIKAIIIDDEPLACAMVREFLNSHSDIEILAECHNGFEGVKAIQENAPDLIFLDVQMPKLNGFEMLELLDEVPPVIFTTAFDEYAMKAFDQNAADYLLKPFSQERFNQAIQKFKERIPQVPVAQERIEDMSVQYPLAERVAIKNGSKIHVLPYDEIFVIEADDDYVVVRTQQGAFAKKRTLSYFERSLPADRFIRVHRGYLVNLNHIARIEQRESQAYSLILSSGQEVPVSRTGMQLLRPLLQK